jgi:hypothetical protein
MKTGALVNGSVTAAKLGASSVGSSALQAGSVDVGNLTTAARRVQTLASGQTETGTFSGGGGDSTSGYIGVGVTYVQPLASPLTHGVEDTFGGTTTE